MPWNTDFDGAPGAWPLALARGLDEAFALADARVPDFAAGLEPRRLFALALDGIRRAAAAVRVLPTGLDLATTLAFFFLDFVFTFFSTGVSH